MTVTRHSVKSGNAADHRLIVPVIPVAMELNKISKHFPDIVAAGRTVKSAGKLHPFPRR